MGDFNALINSQEWRDLSDNVKLELFRRLMQGAIESQFDERKMEKLHPAAYTGMISVKNEIVGLINGINLDGDIERAIVDFGDELSELVTDTEQTLRGRTSAIKSSKSLFNLIKSFLKCIEESRRKGGHVG